MTNINSQNQVNRNQFNQSQGFSDKHSSFMNQNQRSLEEQPTPQMNQTQPKEQFINPHNFEQMLGSKNIVRPAIQQNAPTAAQIQTPQVAQIIKQQVPQMQIPAVKLPENQSQVKGDKTYETLKLVIYVVPIIGIFVLIFKAIDNRSVMWHVRNSLVAQGIWFTVMIILRYLQAPILSNQFVALWNIICYLLLVYAGIQAYNGNQFKIPVAYEIGKSFIEDDE